jgi:hypothetical protein
VRTSPGRSLRYWAVNSIRVVDSVKPRPALFVFAVITPFPPSSGGVGPGECAERTGRLRVSRTRTRCVQTRAQPRRTRFAVKAVPSCRGFGGSESVPLSPNERLKRADAVPEAAHSPGHAPPRPVLNDGDLLRDRVRVRNASNTRRDQVDPVENRENAEGHRRESEGAALEGDARSL